MARTELERSVQQSVLDRLVDDDLRASGDAPLTWGESVRQLKISLRRDLEWLLNTRRTVVAVPDACEEVRSSLFEFGLPDISGRSRDQLDMRGRIAREVEETIALFEPRLTAVRVLLPDDDGRDAHRFRLVVEAMLRLDPSPERIVFDTVLDTARGEFEVGTDGGRER